MCHQQAPISTAFKVSQVYMTAQMLHVFGEQKEKTQKQKRYSSLNKYVQVNKFTKVQTLIYLPLMVSQNLWVCFLSVIHV